MGSNTALFHFVSAVDVLLCAAIIFFNVTLLLVIVCSKAARARTRNALLVSMCMADLLVGAFTHPVYIHSYRTGTFLKSCELHLLLQLIGDYSQDFVCFWTLVTVGGLYVYRLVGQRWGWRMSLPGQYGRLSSSRLPPCLRFCHSVKRILLVAWPWIAVLIIPIPILLVSVDPRAREVFWDETFCPLHITFPARIAVLVLVFYLPMAALLMLVVGIGLASCSGAVRPHQTESLVESDAVYAENGGMGNDSAAFTTSSSRGLGGAVGRRTDTSSSVGGDVINYDADATHVMFPTVNDPAVSARVTSDATEHQDGRLSDRRGMRVSELRAGRMAGVEHVSASDSLAADGEARVTSVILSENRPGMSEAPNSDDRQSYLEQPFHMIVPLVLTLICALPLMIGWWFYAGMKPEEVIVMAVTLHRLYLLRAALLPASWFLLPDLRQALSSLWRRIMFCGGCRGIVGRGERGEFSVAYSTLQESRDGSAAPDVLTGPERRHNPFNETERV